MKPAPEKWYSEWYRDPMGTLFVVGLSLAILMTAMAVLNTVMQLTGQPGLFPTWSLFLAGGALAGLIVGCWFWARRLVRDIHSKTE